MKRPSKEQIRHALNLATDELHLFLPKASRSDPAYQTYIRLLGLGVEKDEAVKKIACVSILLKLGHESQAGVTNDLVDILYDALPNSDPESALLAMSEP